MPIFEIQLIRSSKQTVFVEGPTRLAAEEDALELAEDEEWEVVEAEVDQAREATEKPFRFWSGGPHGKWIENDNKVGPS